MIDKIKAEQAFQQYVLPYDVQNPKIAIKIAHIYRTAQIAEEIAKSITLDEENIQLAWLIGLLHDIGRFEQLRIYDTFNDSISINHAEFGVKVLFEDNIIRQFIEETTYDDIIRNAIQNHNRYEIEEGLNEQELVHAKIIRDADKTDIFRVHVKELEEKNNVLYPEELKTQKVSQKVLEQFLLYQSIHSSHVRNDIDRFVLIVAFIYDYHYQKGLQIIKENKYIERMIKAIEGCQETEEQVKILKETAMNFLEKNIH